ncbi:RidA family protein [Roseovarius phycicola]|uniref:RidA family protein n=1 Tax=Roseovarius phycicola TaxID=3080976 RepID=A0ABZ2HM71_9RHOB
MTIRFNTPANWPTRGRPYHHGVVQPVGCTLHITGQVAWDSVENIVGAGDCEAQAHQCFDNVEAVLSAVGGRMDDIVSLTVFYVDPADVPTIQKVRADRLDAAHGPVSILIQCAGLVDPEFLVEVIPVAVIPEDRFQDPRA